MGNMTRLLVAIGTGENGIFSEKWEIPEGLETFVVEKSLSGCILHYYEDGDFKLLGSIIHEINRTIVTFKPIDLSDFLPQKTNGEIEVVIAVYNGHWLVLEVPEQTEENKLVFDCLQGDQDSDAIQLQVPTGVYRAVYFCHEQPNEEGACSGFKQLKLVLELKRESDDI